MPKISPHQKIALVTGANRGIGLEICKQLAQQRILVILTSRTSAGKKVAQQLQKSGLPIVFHQLDVASEAQRKRIHRWVVKQYARLDILVNNAGVFLDHPQPGTFDTSVFHTTPPILRKTMETNVYAPFRLCQLFIPLMKKNNYGRIVNISSRMGQLSTMSGKDAAYRISKTALNAVTRIFAAETKGSNILINSVHPGWVRTAMGGSKAPLTPEQGAVTPVWLATLSDHGPSGKFFFEKKEMEW